MTDARRTDLESLDFRPVQSTRNFEAVVQQIRDAILDGRLTTGSRLPPEREMAVVFKVSRASLREALRVLEALGVLTAKRGTGPESGYVINPAEANQFANLLQLQAILLGIGLLDLLQIREVVESMTIELACERATAQDHDELRSIIDRMRGPLVPEEFLECDTGFHVAIARCSGNGAAPLIMEALRGAIAHQMLEAFRQVEDWPAERATLVREHLRILNVIESGDSTHAADGIRDHLNGFYSRLPGLTKKTLPKQR